VLDSQPTDNPPHHKEQNCGLQFELIMAGNAKLRNHDATKASTHKAGIHCSRWPQPQTTGTSGLWL
jgi:hypothetical protein